MNNQHYNSQTGINEKDNDYQNINQLINKSDVNTKLRPRKNQRIVVYNFNRCYVQESAKPWYKS